MLNFYSIENISNTEINYNDIYYTPEYGKACEYSDNASWEICQYKDLIYVYLKKKYLFNKIIYFDLITPYGYSGFYFTNNETFDEFIDLFRIEGKKRNYITEVVRQNHYLNINISKKYNIILTRKTFGVNLKNYDNFNQYLKDTNKDNRKAYRSSIKNNLIFKIEDFNKDNLSKFLKIYNTTMNNLNSKDYYYFNEEYFNTLMQLNKSFFANVYHNNILISSCIILKYKKIIHYHLGGSYLEYRNLRPNNLIHCSLIKYGIDNQYHIYHLGGGLKDNDSLYKFKEKIATDKFNYTIYKNVLNENIYEEISKKFNSDEYFPIHRMI